MQFHAAVVPDESAGLVLGQEGMSTPGCRHVSVSVHGQSAGTVGELGSYRARHRREDTAGLFAAKPAPLTQ